MGNAPFLQIHFFRAHDPGIPTKDGVKTRKTMFSFFEKNCMMVPLIAASCYQRSHIQDTNPFCIKASSTVWVKS